MPANNRVHSSAALQTHGIWQSAIGYDPYAPTNKDSDKGSAGPGEDGAAASSENAYASFQGLLALARVTGSGSNEARGACKKCGRVGHLTFQCRNFLSAKDPDKDKDDAGFQAAATAAFEQIKKSNGLKAASSEEDDEEESDSSDSDVDPEIEKIIAARFGKKSKKNTDHKRANDPKGEKVSHRHRGRSRQRSRRKRSDDSDESDSDEEDEKRQKRRRRRRGSDEDVEEDKHGHRHSRRSRRDKKRRKSHRERDESDDYNNDDSEDESDKRHRHHHKRRHHRRNNSGSDSDDGNSDKAKIRKKSRRHHDQINIESRE